MINYEDFEKLIFPYNFVGDVDGLSETFAIPDDQAVDQIDGKSPVV